MACEPEVTRAKGDVPPAGSFRGRRILHEEPQGILPRINRPSHHDPQDCREWRVSQDRHGFSEALRDRRRGPPEGGEFGRFGQLSVEFQSFRGDNLHHLGGVFPPRCVNFRKGFQTCSLVGIPGHWLEHSR